MKRTKNVLWRFALRRTLIFCALVACVPQLVVGQDVEKIAFELAELSATLLKDRESISLVSARSLLRRAGESKNVAIIPELKAIAEQEQSERLISLGAMDALWRLGEGDDYFCRFLGSPQVSRVQQVNAIWILARNTNDECTSRIDSITWQEGDNRLSGAIQVYRYSRRQQEKYAELAETLARVRFLGPFATRGYNRLRIDENDPETSLFPLTVWARRELSRLCEDDPSNMAAAAAEYLKELKASSEEQWDEEFEEYFRTMLKGKCVGSH